MGRLGKVIKARSLRKGMTVRLDAGKPPRLYDPKAEDTPGKMPGPYHYDRVEDVRRCAEFTFVYTLYYSDYTSGGSPDVALMRGEIVEDSMPVSEISPEIFTQGTEGYAIGCTPVPERVYRWARRSASRRGWFAQYIEDNQCSLIQRCIKTSTSVACYDLRCSICGAVCMLQEKISHDYALYKRYARRGWKVLAFDSMYGGVSIPKPYCPKCVESVYNKAKTRQTTRRKT